MNQSLSDFQKISGFISYNHFQLKSIIEGQEVTMNVELTEDSLNPYGAAHGGLIFGLGDTAMGIIAATTGKKAVTLSSNINYLRPAIGKRLIAKAQMIKDGKHTCYLKVDIYNDEDVLVATMDGNYYYVD